MSDIPSVGASTAIMAIFSGFLVFLILNWNHLEQYGPFRCILLMIVCMIVLMTFSGSYKTSDLFGHLGIFIDFFKFKEDFSRGFVYAFGCSNQLIKEIKIRIIINLEW